MQKFTLIATKGGSATYDITPLVEDISWKGRKGSSARSITVKLLDDDGHAHARSEIDVEEGCQCLMSCDGKERFRGIITSTKQSDGKIMSFTAYENGIYLANNRDTFSFTDKTASEIFRAVCARFGFEVGSVATTSYKIPELIKKKATGWDVICDALSLEYKATGIRHYVTSTGGKLDLIVRRENILQWVLEVGQNITSYTYSRSIEDVRTRIRLLSDEGTVLAESYNSELEKKIGIMQEIENVDETLSDAQLKDLCKSIMGEISTPSRVLDLEVLGLPDVISGIGVVVIIPHLGLSRTFYVEQDTHTFKGNKHTMSLKLSYATDIDPSTASGGNSQVQTSVKSAFQSTMTVGSGLLQGRVISTSPLQIQIVNDNKLIITRTSAIIPRHLTDHSVGYSVDGGPTQTVMVYSGLIVGDNVHLLSLQGGKKFYVLGKV